MPYTITGPAIENICLCRAENETFVFPFKCGDTTLFAKPVIGTIVPAPACLAILSKTPAPVKIAVIIINTLDVADDTSFH